MGFLRPSQPTITPVPTPQEVLTPAKAPTEGTSKPNKNRTPSFLGSADVPTGAFNAGGKTLLGS